MQQFTSLSNAKHLTLHNDAFRPRVNRKICFRSANVKIWNMSSLPVRMRV
jgi:hypothetical protein